MKSLLRCLPVVAVAAVAMMAVTQPTKTGLLPLRTIPVQKELARLQGNWVYTSIVGDQFPDVEYDEGDEAEMNGAEQDIAESLPATPLHFQGNQMYFGNASCTFTVEPTTTPKQIDFMFSDDPEKRIWKGIYETDGDNLSICLGLSPEVPRPTEFTGKEGSYCSLQTHARVAGMQASVPPTASRRKNLERVTSMQVIPLIGESCRIVMRSSKSDPFWQWPGGRIIGEVIRVEEDRVMLNMLEREGVSINFPARYGWLNRLGMGRERKVQGQETWIALKDIASITSVGRRVEDAVGQSDPRPEYNWTGRYVGDVYGGRSSPGTAR